MLTAGRATLTAAGANQRTTAVEILTPTLTTNTHYGESTPTWTNPTVSSTVNGTLQAASTRALERAARIGANGVHELYLDPVTLTPLGRVRIGSQQYTVLDARMHKTHTHAIVEEVNA